MLQKHIFYREYNVIDFWKLPFRFILFETQIWDSMKYCCFRERRWLALFLPDIPTYKITVKILNSLPVAPWTDFANFIQTTRKFRSILEKTYGSFSTTSVRYVTLSVPQWYPGPYWSQQQHSRRIKGHQNETCPTWAKIEANYCFTFIHSF